MSTAGPQARFFSTRAEFSAETLAMIERAETELLMFDPTYRDWAANSPGFVAALDAFLRRGPRVRLRLVVDSNERVVRDLPRITVLLRDHAHAAECRQLPERYRSLDETLVIADATSALRRPSAASLRGVVRLLDFDYAASLRDRFQELWEACTDRLAPTSLGL